MVQRRITVPRLVIPGRNMPELRSDRDNSVEGPEPDDLRGLSPDRRTMVPNRICEPKIEGTGSTPAELHIALIVPDIKIYGTIRKTTYLLTPPDWKGKMRLHVLIKDPKEDERGMLLRYLAKESNLATSHEARLLYPESIELGWSE